MLEPANPVQRHIQYAFTLRNQTNRVADKTEFWTYAPVKRTATQQCIRIRSSQPYNLMTDSLGNQVLHFVFDRLPPYASRVITIEADLRLTETPFSDTASVPQQYLRAEKLCKSDDPRILRLAETLQGRKPVNTAENIFKWVAGNVRYAGYIQNPRGALYALRHKKGDCTEFMYLFTALCRAAGLPARGIGGFVASANAVLKPVDYHNWAEFYAGGSWQIADPQRKIFMQALSHFIAMRVVGHAPDNPLGEGVRYRLKGKGIKVIMNG